MNCPECNTTLESFAASCGTGVFAPDGYEEQVWEEGMFCPRCRSIFTSDEGLVECAKCGAGFAESPWLSLCKKCGESEDELPFSLTRASK